MKRIVISIIAALVSGPTFATAEEKPNLIVILCDDLGYGDLSSYGHKIIKTPHLDQLAKSGIRFTDGYTAAPVWSPARAGLLTGRDPQRAGIYDWIPSGNIHLRESETTIPELLKTQGYHTMLSGKWHLNGMFNKPEAQPTPSDHGFDYWFATHNNASPNHANPRNFVRNGEKVGATEGFSSSIVVKETLAWIDSLKDKNAPFFSYIAFHESHTPVASPPELVAEYEPKATLAGQAEYWANVAQMDRAVGELIAGLKKRNKYENTLIVFTSDNGPEEWMRYPGCRLQHGSVGPHRGHKLDVFEGGIRVPFIVSWPKKIQPNRTSPQVVSSLDLLPSLCKLAGAEVPQDLKLDGCDITSHLIENKDIQRSKPLLWFYGTARGYANFALRDNDYKLVARRTGRKFYPGIPTSNAEKNETLRTSKPRGLELFAIRKDPKESYSLLKQNSDKAKELDKALLEQWEDILKDVVDWETWKQK